MSFLRSNKFITFICLLAATLLLAFGISAFIPMHESASASTNGIFAAVNMNFNMFKSFTAFKTWLGAIPYYVYLIIVLALFLIAVICIVIAVCKKARYRRNDVNVLILVDDDDEKVDTTVFKEHYAVIVVAKPSSLTPIQTRVLPPRIPLANNIRYIPIPNANPQQRVEKENVITIANEELVKEQPQVKEQPVVAIVEHEEHVKKVINEPVQPTQSVNKNEVFNQANSDVNDNKLVSENFEEIKFDQDEFNISPIVIDTMPELISEEPQSIVVDQKDNFECITMQEEIKPKVKKKTVNVESTCEVQEFPQDNLVNNYQSDTSEMAFEAEEVTDDVPLADIAIADNRESLLIIDTASNIKANTEDYAYAIVKEKDATANAIEAVQDGAVVVDADGDDVIDELLEDKDILKMRYKTVDFDKRLKRTEEAVKGHYSDLKNALLSYKGVKSRMSKKFDTFTLGRFVVAKMALRGNVLNLYLALPSEQVDDKYSTEDVGDSDTYGKTPTLYKVKSKRGSKYGVELIHELLNAIAVPKLKNFTALDYVAMYPADNIEDKKLEIEHLISDRVFLEDTDALSDEAATEFIQIVKDKNHTINKFNPINKFVAFIDDIAELYENGETVTIDNLITKGALPDMDNLFLEIRAKGYIDKALTVEAHSFDIKVVKMITLAGGSVVQYK